ncbi:winged helix-turn-helix domain-containing protein [Azospirillum soli]|uniref:winged helix-turn-helix domain-containing protein n=1 Tax=Azospirillum soli TaxID=1304799 RepID=UPI001AE69EDF|nr:winged helix-turn-helix domain-containing protein [Azospirillum soli]MBP2313914.1 molybdate transport system regulatory protein [Azospirillum soli]
MTRLRIRIDFEPGGSIGPGKIKLLEQIRETGSISAAARALEMSYRRAWLLVDDLNRIFREPVVSAAVGGKHGGGTALTAFGEQVIDHYRAVEREAHVATAHRLAALQATVNEDYGAEGEPPDDGSFSGDPGVKPGCKSGG